MLPGSRKGGSLERLVARRLVRPSGLARGRPQHSDLVGADLSAADLCQANLRGADLSYASLIKAQLIRFPAD